MAYPFAGIGKYILDGERENSMNNPNGPYPGRQLFLGMTAKGSPAFAYLVTGRTVRPVEREEEFWSRMG